MQTDAARRKQTRDRLYRVQTARRGRTRHNFCARLPPARRGGVYGGICGHTRRILGRGRTARHCGSGAGGGERARRRFYRVLGGYAFGLGYRRSYRGARARRRYGDDRNDGGERSRRVRRSDKRGRRGKSRARKTARERRSAGDGEYGNVYSKRTRAGVRSRKRAIRLCAGAVSLSSEAGQAHMRTSHRGGTGGIWGV